MTYTSRVVRHLALLIEDVVLCENGVVIAQEYNGPDGVAARDASRKALASALRRLDKRLAKPPAETYPTESYPEMGRAY